MRLDDARLCLDCEELHEERDCPACGSEASAFLKRWIKTTGNGGRRAPGEASSSVPPRQEPASEQLDAWRRIVEGRPEAPGKGKLVVRGLVGLAAMGLAGWAWSKTGAKGATGASGASGVADSGAEAGRALEREQG